MSVLPEIREQFLLNLEPNDLIQLCSVDTIYRSLCESPVFWKSKFSARGLPLMNQQSTFPGWINEYRHTEFCVNKAREIMIEYPDEAVFVSMKNVNTANIFPDYAQRDILQDFLAESRIYGDGDDNDAGDISLERDETLTLDYNTQTRFHSIPLSPERATYIIFLFFYYSLQPFDVNETPF